ncbi:restriction endonuclease subunit S [Sphingobacterium multivorum]|uniref:restriction endonuclease subunit S n=1 Tax=Sphingobacterium multivorum TaxID=28454 RepID=UPI00368DFEEA
MQRYEKYKDSGIKWLGEIPEHWEVRKIKYLFNEINERALDGSGDLLSVSQYSGVQKKADKLNEGDLLTNASTLEGYKVVRKKQLVSNIMLAWNGSLAFSDYDGITSPAYCVYELKANNYYKYFHYLLKTGIYKSEFKRKSSGVIESRLRLYTEDFFSISSILPPIHEQYSIANFLDNKCAKIDGAIILKEQQIEKLKELQQISIHNAVTKGITHSSGEVVKMRDSGIDWIGEIPEYWDVMPIKYFTYMQSGETISAENFVEEGYPVFGGNGFRGYAKRYTNEGKTILIGRQGALCGNVNYADGKFFASEHAIVVYPTKEVNLKWLGEIIRLADFNRLSQSAAQPGIAVNVIKNVLFPFPSFKEQCIIGDYLNEQTSKIDKAIAQKQEQIVKLKEYKQSLINEVVTGKLKVVD